MILNHQHFLSITLRKGFAHPIWKTVWKRLKFYFKKISYKCETGQRDNKKQQQQHTPNTEKKEKRKKKLQLYRIDVERHWKYSSSIRVVFYQSYWNAFCETGNFQFTHTVTHQKKEHWKWMLYLMWINEPKSPRRRRQKTRFTVRERIHMKISYNVIFHSLMFIFIDTIIYLEWLKRKKKNQYIKESLIF